MIKIIKFNSFLNENNEQNLDTKKELYSSIIDDISDLINKTIETNGGEFETFKNSYINDNSDDVKINGLINDYDIIDFYNKYKNEIDEVLNDINFFSNINKYIIFSNSLYSIMISATILAVKEICKII